MGNQFKILKKIHIQDWHLYYKIVFRSKILALLLPAGKRDGMEDPWHGSFLRKSKSYNTYAFADNKLGNQFKILKKNHIQDWHLYYKSVFKYKILALLLPAEKRDGIEDP